MRGVKYYASGLAIGMAMGPFIASNISTGDIMRGAFLVFGITATACLLVNNLATTPSRAPYLTIQEDHQSIRSMSAMLSPIIILLAALTLSPTGYHGGFVVHRGGLVAVYRRNFITEHGQS